MEKLNAHYIRDSICTIFAPTYPPVFIYEIKTNSLDTQEFKALAYSDTW